MPSSKACWYEKKRAQLCKMTKRETGSQSVRLFLLFRTISCQCRSHYST
jgi:hypothetical protein